MSKKIPIVDYHRGIGLHNHQSPARLRVVKAAIDRVAGLSNIAELVAFAEDAKQPPEARLYAQAKILAEYQLSAEERRNRPDVDVDRLGACTTGLDSVKWRSPTHFGSMFDREQGVEREEPLPEGKE